VRTRGKGFFKCGRPSALFGAKPSDFSKFMIYPYGRGEGGLSQCGHFADNGGKVNFRDFVSFTNEQKQMILILKNYNFKLISESNLKKNVSL